MGGLNIIWLYQLLCLIFLPPFSSSVQLCSGEESFALLQFKQLFSIDSFASIYCQSNGVPSYPKTLSWLKNTDCCTWDGVTCDRFKGHVIGLDLSCSQLYGTISPNSTLFLLPHLQRLNLAFNDFNNSHILSEFGLFSSLTHLNLSGSQFSGQVPSEISHLSKLVSLDLFYSYKATLETLTMQRLAQNLTELKVLILDQVDMSSVPPTSLMNLSSSLTTLGLRTCGLEGEFPDNIFRLPNLQTISLIGNFELTGQLPKGNWSSPLRTLELSSTNFSGNLPDSITNLKSLKILDLYGCNFTGSIPASLGNLTQLTFLALSSNKFTGQIPSSLSNRELLTYLELTRNNLEGRIPDVLGNLTQLSFLDFSNNQLTGPIPLHATGLSKLTYLYLSSNILDGTIPSWLLALPSLLSIDLSHNQLTGQIDEFQNNSLKQIDLSDNELQGPIPSSIFELVNLTDLILSSNNFSGVIMMDMFIKLVNLERLDISHNNLLLSTNSSVNSTLPQFLSLSLSSCRVTGFSDFLRTQEKLVQLDLSDNQIHGQIPKWIWELGQETLSLLNISHNFLTGTIENPLPWKKLSYLDLHSNLLQGPLPSPVPQSYMTLLSISNNNLSGDIPSTICNNRFLGVLDLSYNNLSGKIPECMGNLSDSLSVLDLRMNKFHGTIPAMLEMGNKLRTLNLNGNNLEGLVPRSLLNCQKLEVLDLGNNEINDTFPYWLDSLPEFQVLVLRSNKFHGSIRSSEAKLPFPKLRIIDLSNNDFSGPLPIRDIQNFKAMMNMDDDKIQLQYMGEEYYQDSMTVTIKGLDMELVKILTIFTTIDLSNNLFEGEIPTLIGKLSSLCILNFSHNSLTSHIPSSLENLTALESLDLCSNKLTGVIPRQLTSLTFLAVLNLSQNYLVGPIPQGQQFDTFENNSYSGNLGLCGFSMSVKCSTGEEAPVIENDSESGSGFSWKVVVMGYGCGTVFGLVMGYLMFLTGKPKWFSRIVQGKIYKKVKGSNKSSRRRTRRIKQQQADGH